MTELRWPLLQATTVAPAPTTAITQRLFFIMNLLSRETTCPDRHEVLSRRVRRPAQPLQVAQAGRIVRKPREQLAPALGIVDARYRVRARDQAIPQKDSKGNSPLAGTATDHGRPEPSR